MVSQAEFSHPRLNFAPETAFAGNGVRNIKSPATCTTNGVQNEAVPLAGVEAGYCCDQQLVRFRSPFRRRTEAVSINSHPDYRDPLLPEPCRRDNLLLQRERDCRDEACTLHFCLVIHTINRQIAVEGKAVFCPAQ